MTASDQAQAAPPGDRSAAALDRHLRRMRRLSMIYAAVLVGVVAVGAVIVGLVWVTGEVHNTHLHTDAHPPATLAPSTPSPQLTQLWSTSDTVALGVPLWHGTIVTLGRHVVRGRDARTGAVTWSYTRTNRTPCTAAQSGGVTIAIFRVNGNCDEVTALDSDTGARRWTRTLDMDGHPVNGTPVVSATPYSVMVTTPQVIYTLDPSSGYDRWEYHPDACTIGGAVLGDAGALISQTCRDPDCSSVRAHFCGAGPQLLLRDPYEGRDGDNRKTGRNKDGRNIDQLIWNDLGNTDIPVSAGAVVSALNRTTHELDVIDAAHGRLIRSVALAPVPADLAGVSAQITSESALVRLGSAVHAVRRDGTQAWSHAASGPATVTAPAESTWPPAPADARIVVTSGAAVLLVDGGSGGVLARSALPSTVLDGTRAYPLGSGYLVAAQGGTVAYR